MTYLKALEGRNGVSEEYGKIWAIRKGWELRINNQRLDK